MFGWFNAARTLASRSNRASRSGSWARAEGSTLIATSRSSLVSRARYTSPIPPAPIGARISYGPNFSPAERDIGVSDQSNKAGSSRQFKVGRALVREMTWPAGNVRAPNFTLIIIILRGPLRSALFLEVPYDRRVFGA